MAQSATDLKIESTKYFFKLLIEPICLAAFNTAMEKKIKLEPQRAEYVQSSFKDKAATKESARYLESIRISTTVRWAVFQSLETRIKQPSMCTYTKKTERGTENNAQRAKKYPRHVFICLILKRKEVTTLLSISVPDDKQGEGTHQLHTLQIFETKKKPKAQFFEFSGLRRKRKSINIIFSLNLGGFQKLLPWTYLLW